MRLATYSETLALNPHGRKKFICPQCGARSFVPYIYDHSDDPDYNGKPVDDDYNGKPVDVEECGRCDHAESCAYHETPAQYFAKYPDRRPNNGMTKEERAAEWRKRQQDLRHERQRMDREKLLKEFEAASQSNAQTEAESAANKALCRHPWELVAKSEERAQETTLFRFLCQHFEPERVREVFRLYHVGGDKYGRTIFWQIDRAGEVHAGKVMKYADNGHRAKNEDGTPAPGATNWVHSIQRKSGKLPEGWKLEQCLFGEHLLSSEDMPAPVCLVEAEKSAIIGACAMPQYIWVATGGKYNLKRETLGPLFEYSRAAGAVTVFPDLGSREDWAARLEPFRLLLPFTLSDFLESKAPDAARAKGLDIADYLVGEF